GDAIGGANERIAADRINGEIAAFLVVLLRADRLRRDALVREHAVDRAPIGMLDVDVVAVGRPTAASTKRLLLAVRLASRRCQCFRVLAPDACSPPNAVPA